MDTNQLLKQIQHSALEVKAFNPIAIDFEGKSSIADCLFVCHGTSTTHARGISERIELDLKKRHQIYPMGIEGQVEGNWVLMDYNTVIAHVFTEELRGRFDFEELYNGFKQLDLSSVDI